MAYEIIDTNDINYIPRMTNRNVIGAVTINGYSAQTVPAWACATRLLATNLASFPRCVAKDGVDLDSYHALDQILKRKPNQYQTATAFWTTLFHNAVSKKAGFAKIIRTSLADPTPIALYVLDPTTITPFRVLPTDSEGNPMPEDGEQFFYDQQYKRVIPNADMIYLHLISEDGLNTNDPCEQFSETLQRAKLYDRYLTMFIKKGTRIKGWVSMPAGTTDEQAQQIVDTLKKYKGVNSEDDLAVLSGGAELHNDTISPEESQLTQQIQLNNKQVSQITGVPPDMLFEGAESKYNQNLDGMNAYLVTYTFRPWIEAAEDELTVKLLSDKEQADNYTICIDPDELLRGDTKTQSAVIVAEKAAGIINANESRNALGYPADPSPEANQLQTLGATQGAAPAAQGAVPAPNPSGTAPEAPKAPQNASQTAETAFAALKPLLLEAADRVERKTVKAFETATTGANRTIWGNVFADQQAKYVSDCFATLAVSYSELTGKQIDVAKLAEHYGLEIRKRVAGNPAKSLAEYVGEII